MTDFSVGALRHPVTSHVMGAQRPGLSRAKPARPAIGAATARSLLAGFEESARGVVYPGELRPQSATTLAALAGAWLAALASAQSSRPGGRSPGARLRRDKPGRCAPIQWQATGVTQRSQLTSVMGWWTGAKRPGLSERSEAPGDRPGGPDDSPGASLSEHLGL